MDRNHLYLAITIDARETTCEDLFLKRVKTVTGSKELKLYSGPKDLLCKEVDASSQRGKQIRTQW